MLNYLCFTPSTALELPLQWGVRLGGPISPYLASTQVGVLNRLVVNRLGAQPRDRGAIVCKNLFNISVKQNYGRGRDSQPCPRPRLSSQPQGLLRPSVDCRPELV